MAKYLVWKKEKNTSELGIVHPYFMRHILLLAIIVCVESLQVYPAKC